ncbi:MAG: hypothetical protein V3W04_13745 [Gammaproteobacteria bacterium]
MKRLTRREVQGWGLRYEQWEAALFEWQWEEHAMPVRYFYSQRSMEAWARRTGLHFVYPHRQPVPAPVNDVDPSEQQEQPAEHGATETSAILLDFTQYRKQGDYDEVEYI